MDIASAEELVRFPLLAGLASKVVSVLRIGVSITMVRLAIEHRWSEVEPKVERNCDSQVDVHAPSNPSLDHRRAWVLGRG